MADAFFEIAQILQEVSEQNLKLAHATYERLMNFFTGAMDAWMEATPSYPDSWLQGSAGPRRPLREGQGFRIHIRHDQHRANITGGFDASDGIRS